MRVIMGNVRRLLLRALGRLDTRPITGRIKGTLLNMPQPELADYMFLDLFSGNGAIGIGALSRGAGLAVMIENNSKVSERARENLSRIELEEQVMVMGCNVITGLKCLEDKNYKPDITFMNPSYNHEYEQLVLNYLNHSSMATEEALTVTEASRETESEWPEEFGWYMIESKEYKTNKHVSVGRGEQMRTAVYPESFGPVTLGHYNIIERTAKMVDKLIIGVFNNRAKCPLLSVQERVNILKRVALPLSNVEIQSLEGLLTDLVRKNCADTVVGGLRAIIDFGYEPQMAQTNRIIVPEIDTIFLITDLRYSYLSSSIVKETMEYEGDINEFSHPVIVAGIREKLEERRRLT